MRYATELPRHVEVRHAWIPMPDGARLHARIWLPTDADADPVPALLEYLPYRKDDWTAPRDAERHPWYAGHGYASVRVDSRGNGDSEGLFEDEYSETELSDGEAVLAWLAAQPWCTGRLGMFGISWGGFNSLQLAARRPAGLAAIVTVCSTDDRYDNDVHYTGGALLGIDQTAWAGAVLAFAARPPDPGVVGERWLDMWRERLVGQVPVVLPWTRHQQRDDYWRHGSVSEDYAAITAATLAIGGWADPYHDTVLRLLQHLHAPVKGIVGPWAHQYPDRAHDPGPAIGFLQETLRWWDRWLKDAATGVEDDPDLRVFVNDSRRPATSYGDVAGRWLATSWPSPAVSPRTIRLSASSQPLHEGWALVRSPQHTGIDAGRFFPFGNRTDLPPDQRAEDGRSLSLDTPLAEDLPVLGRVRVRLHVDSTTPRANVIVRLCDVAPDGSSTLVTRGVLNLAARRGRDRAVPFVPGTAEDVEVELTATGWVVPAGHTLRVAVSDAYWPWVWPHGERGALRVHVPSSWVEVPALTELPGSDQVTWEEPEQAPPSGIVYSSERAAGPDGLPLPQREVRHDVETGVWTLDVDPGYGGSRTFPDGLVFFEDARETYVIQSDDPTSGRALSVWSVALVRGDWHARIRTRQELTASAEAFHVRAEVVAEHVLPDGTVETVSDRRWEEEILRTSV